MYLMLICAYFLNIISCTIFQKALKIANTKGIGDRKCQQYISHTLIASLIASADVSGTATCKHRFVRYNMSEPYTTIHKTLLLKAFSSSTYEISNYFRI